jgi:hypothetical protein
MNSPGLKMKSYHILRRSDFVGIEQFWRRWKGVMSNDEVFGIKKNQFLTSNAIAPKIDLIWVGKN